MSKHCLTLLTLQGCGSTARRHSLLCLCWLLEVRHQINQKKKSVTICGIRGRTFSQATSVTICGIRGRTFSQATSVTICGICGRTSLKQHPCSLNRRVRLSLPQITRIYTDMGADLLYWAAGLRRDAIASYVCAGCLRSYIRLIKRKNL